MRKIIALLGVIFVVSACEAAEGIGSVVGGFACGARCLEVGDDTPDINSNEGEIVE